MGAGMSGYGALELRSDEMGPWPNTSLEGVRDAIIDGRLTSIALDGVPQDETRVVLRHLTEAAQEAIVAGRLIDAGHLPNAIIRSEAKRAKNLILDGWIGHPFREPYVIFHTWEEGAAPLIVMPHPDRALTVQIAELVPCTMKGVRSLLVGDVGELSPGVIDSPEGGFMVRCRVSPLKRMHAPAGSSIEGLMRDAACNLGDPLWTVLAMLATDGVAIDHVAAPEKLNRQRAAKGRWAIPPHLRVRSGPYVTALQNRARGLPKGTSEAGHHASPVMHLRRGHPRLLPSGRRVWVRDAVIGAKGDGEPTRSHYAMKPV